MIVCPAPSPAPTPVLLFLHIWIFFCSPLVKLGPIGISLVLITLTLLKALQAPSRALFDAAHFLPFWWVYFVPFPCHFFISHFSPCLTSVSLSLPLSIISPSSWLAFFLSALKSSLCLLPESAGTMKSVFFFDGIVDRTGGELWWREERLKGVVYMCALVGGILLIQSVKSTTEQLTALC